MLLWAGVDSVSFPPNQKFISSIIQGHERMETITGLNVGLILLSSPLYHSSIQKLRQIIFSKWISEWFQLRAGVSLSFLLILMCLGEGKKSCCQCYANSYVNCKYVALDTCIKRRALNTQRIQYCAKTVFVLYTLFKCLFAHISIT